MRPNLIFGLVIAVLSSHAQASKLSLYCENTFSPKICQKRIVQAARSVGCSLDVQSFECAATLNENGTPATTGNTFYCEIQSSNCSEPLQGLFGGDSCDNSKMVAYDSSSGVNNGYWYGFLGSYSRNLCVEQ